MRIIQKTATLALLAILATPGQAQADGERHYAPLLNMAPRTFRVLRAEMKAAMPADKWRELKRMALQPAVMRSSWIGEDREGFVRRGRNKKPMTYLRTPESRRPYQLDISENRQIVDARGRPFGTGQDETMLVATPDGLLYGQELFSKREKKVWAHSSYNAGAPTLMPIEARPRAGKLEQMKNRSGHYRRGRLPFFVWLLQNEDRLDIADTIIEFDPRSKLHDKEGRAAQ